MKSKIPSHAIPGLILSFSLLSVGCKEDVVEVDAPTNPRDYTFTVDTLSQTDLYDIAGTSPQNVFAIGSPRGSLANSIVHYDGTSWKTTGFSSDEGGPIAGPADPSSILVRSTSDVWVVGGRWRPNRTPPPNYIDSGFILHFNGWTWQEFVVPGARTLMKIHGRAPNDIWACGGHGTMLHYDGVRWAQDSIPLSFSQDWYFYFNEVTTTTTGDVYALGSASLAGGPNTYYFFRRRSGTWAVVDSFPGKGPDYLRWGTSALWASPSGKLYSGGPGVYRWDDPHWVKLFDTHFAVANIWGFSDDNFFVGGFSSLLHFNGRDLYQYPELKGNFVFWGFWGNGKELFALAPDSYRTFIYHGR